MSTENKSVEELQDENADLRQRLEEAEATLRAIREGEVDAVMVSTRYGDQVYTLAGADRTYRLLIETINEGVAVLTTGGDILYANIKLAKILNLPLEQVIGSSIREYIFEAERETFDALLAQGGRGCTGTVHIHAGAENLTPIRLAFGNLHFENSPGALSMVVTDLTQQKRYEAIMAEGRLCTQILAQATQPVVVCDRSGQIIQASQVAHLLCTCNPLFLPFQEAFTLRHPITSELFSLEDVMHGKALVSEEMTYHRQDGTKSYFLINAGPIATGGQEINGCVITFIDITERKRAEEALRESEELFRGLFQNSHSIMLLIDQEAGRIMDANRAACGYYGISREDILAKKIYDINILTPEQIFQEMQRAKKEERKQFEFRHRLANGEIRDVEVFSGPIQIKGKTLLYSIVHDVTARKLAEQKVFQLAAIVQSSDDAIIGKTLDGIITSWNRGAERIYGYHESEVIGQPISILIPTGLEDEVPQILSKIKMGERIEHFESRRRRKDGQLIDMSLTVSPIQDVKGNIAAVSTIGRDITERKRAAEEKEKLEAQLYQAKKMETIGTLAGGLAHNFNNILWAVMGFTELTLYNLPNDSKDRANLQRALQGCDRAKNIVSQFLIFSRQAEPNRQNVQLDALVKETVASLKESLPTNIAVELHIEATPGLISANPSRLKEMLAHLYSNATHAMQATGGTLGVKLEEITLNEEQKTPGQSLPPGLYWQLTITDTGHGMDQTVMDRIFDPFLTTKEVGQGLGLGLSVVYGIVRSHDGSISVSSEPNKGTTVTILLPKVDS